MQKRRILICVTGAEHGGAQTNIAELIAGLSQHFDFHLACGRPGPLILDAQRYGATVHLLKDLAWGLAPQHDAAGLREMSRLIDAVRPQLIHSHTSKAGLYARMLGWRKHIPVAHTAHGWSFLHGAATSRRMAAWLLERAMQPFTSALVCVCHHDRGSAVARLGYDVSRVQVIYPGVTDVPRHLLATPAMLPAPADAHFHLVCIARFSPQKDQPTLLRALALCDLPQLRATFVGDGKTLPACRELAASLGLSGRVRFAGAQDRLPVALLLSVAQAVVLSSHFEGLPISLIEAQRHRLPVIASEVGGVREVVGEDAGILVPAEAPAAISEAIRRLAGDAALQRQMAMNGRASYEQRFGSAAMCERHLQLYERLMTHGRANVA